MQALTVVAPRQAYVEEVAPPTTPGPHEVVVEVARVDLCGTDAEVFSGQMAYLLDGSATYPIRLGHERAGTVTHVGSQVDASWPGRRVTGDTQLGCGQCSRCARGSAQTCPGRSELGLRGEYLGALAEEHVVPASCLCSLAYAVDDTGGALVEPGSHALWAVWGCDPSPGHWNPERISRQVRDGGALRQQPCGPAASRRRDNRPERGRRVPNRRLPVLHRRGPKGPRGPQPVRHLVICCVGRHA